MPTLFTSRLYFANRRGFSAEEIAEALGMPIDWVEERLEAARLCFEYQVVPNVFLA